MGFHDEGVWNGGKTFNINIVTVLRFTLGVLGGLCWTNVGPLWGAMLGFHGFIYGRGSMEVSV